MSNLYTLIYEKDRLLRIKKWQILVLFYYLQIPFFYAVKSYYTDYTYNTVIIQPSTVGC